MSLNRRFWPVGLGRQRLLRSIQVRRIRILLTGRFGETRLAGLGREPSPAVDESGHSRSQRFNVGNLRDTGHSAEATPPAAMAEHLPHI
jgi:hypothetical protein